MTRSTTLLFVLVLSFAAVQEVQAFTWVPTSLYDAYVTAVTDPDETPVDVSECLDLCGLECLDEYECLLYDTSENGVDDTCVCRYENLDWEDVEFYWALWIVLLFCSFAAIFVAFMVICGCECCFCCSYGCLQWTNIFFAMTFAIMAIVYGLLWPYLAIQFIVLWTFSSLAAARANSKANKGFQRGLAQTPKEAKHLLS